MANGGVEETALAQAKAAFDPIAATADVLALLQEAREIKIKDAVSLEKAMEIGRKLKKISTQIENRRKEVADPLYSGWKAVNDTAKKSDEKFQAAVKWIAGQVETYNRELLEAKRKEEERIRLEQQALKLKEEEEKRKQEEAAEKRRQEEAARLKKEEEDRQKAAQAAQPIEQATGVPASVPVPEAPTDSSTQGDLYAPPQAELVPTKAPVPVVEAIEESAEQVQIRENQDRLKLEAARLQTVGTEGVKTNWLFEVTDATKVPREFLMPDEKKIKQAVKDGMRFLEGVRIYEDLKAKF